MGDELITGSALSVALVYGLKTFYLLLKEKRNGKPKQSVPSAEEWARMSEQLDLLCSRFFVTDPSTGKEVFVLYDNMTTIIGEIRELSGSIGEQQEAIVGEIKHNLEEVKKMRGSE